MNIVQLTQWRSRCKCELCEYPFLGFSIGELEWASHCVLQSLVSGSCELGRAGHSALQLMISGSSKLGRVPQSTLQSLPWGLQQKIFRTTSFIEDIIETILVDGAIDIPPVKRGIQSAKRAVQSAKQAAQSYDRYKKSITSAAQELTVRNVARVLGASSALLIDIGVDHLLLSMWLLEQQRRTLSEVSATLRQTGAELSNRQTQLIADAGVQLLRAGTRPLHGFSNGLEKAMANERCRMANQVGIARSWVDSISYKGLQRTPWAIAYQYRTLHSRDEIRIVEIEPAKRNSALRCAIMHHRLRDIHAVTLADGLSSISHAYEALSYTWGNTSNVSRIKCRDKYQTADGAWVVGRYTWLYVTANCEAALRRLRHEDIPRRVWIDALCIDQSNIVERNTQVGLMAQIYQKAAQVVVYLGEASKKESGPICELLELQRSRLLSATDVLREGCLDAVQRLLDQPWFSRIWVLQEVYTATSADALYGTAVFDWRELVIMLQTARSLLWNLLQIQVPYALKIQDDRLCAKNLFDLLCASRHCLSTDPRDKYFALLSMVEDAERNSLAADYSKDVAEVFTKLAIYLLEHIGLDFLVAIDGSSGSGILPSWVPDWSISSGFGHVPASKDITRRAGGDRNAAQFKLGERLMPQLNIDEQISNHILEYDGLEIEFFSKTLDHTDLTSLGSSERESSIIANWYQPVHPNAMIDAPNDQFEDVVEHHGLAEMWSNFSSRTDIHLNPAPEDWSIVIRQYCTDVTASHGAGNDPLQMPVFTIRGVAISIVEYMVPSSVNNDSDLSALVSQWYACIRAQVEFASAEEEVGFLEMFYRTISRDGMSCYDLLGISEASSLDRLPHTQLDDEVDGAEFWPLVRLATANRTLFITADRRLGLCSTDTEAGDCACVFLGSVYPCLIRKGGDEISYMMISGNCYLHGVMDGEAFVEGTKLDEFVIW